MYGSGKYGLFSYGTEANRSGDQTGCFVDIARYVPDFVAALLEMAELYRTEGYELGAIKYAFSDLVDQCFVQTATWGLLRWEEVYGIATNFSLSYEQRREIILAKMRGQGTTTVEMIRSTAIAFSGGEVEVIEDNAHYNFIVRFVGQYGIPRNMQAFKEMLEEIKPAHLGYTLEYRFVIWNELKPYIWLELEPYTWDGLRVKEIRKFVRWNGIAGRSWMALEGMKWNEIKQIEEAMT